MTRSKREKNCHCNGGARTWVVGLVACLVVLSLGAPVMAQLEVVKECASNNGDGTYTYDVKVTNTGTAPLESCSLNDTNPVPAACTPLSQASLVPGQMATTECTSDSNMNMVEVTCTIAGTQKTVSDEAMAACVDVDKQVSCSNGNPGTFVDVGYNDSIAESCPGWSTDPNDPAGTEIVFRYRVRTGGAMTQCVLVDSNPAIPPAPPIGDLPAKFDGVVYTTQILTCDQVEPGEPDRATLTCIPVPEPGDPPQPPVSDTDDADLECQEPGDLQVDKACDPGFNEGTGLYEYTVTVSNAAPPGSADLTDCVVTDTNATGCDAVIPSIAAGDTETIACSSEFKLNTVSVTCNNPKPVTQAADADCGPPTLDVDKQVSCDGGVTWHGVGPEDPTGGFESCIGWQGTPGEIKFRWLASSSGGIVEDCVLTDSNPVLLGGPVQVGDFPDGMIHMTDLLECNDQLLSGEPNKSTLRCTCPQGPGVDDEIMAMDWSTVEDCQEAQVEVTKECTSNNGDGTYTYDVKVTNTATANLVNCRLIDTNPVPATFSPLAILRVRYLLGRWRRRSCATASRT